MNSYFKVAQENEELKKEILKLKQENIDKDVFFAHSISSTVGEVSRLFNRISEKHPESDIVSYCIKGEAEAQLISSMCDLILFDRMDNKRITEALTENGDKTNLNDTVMLCLEKSVSQMFNGVRNGICQLKYLKKEEDYFTALKEFKELPPFICTDLLKKFLDNNFFKFSFHFDVNYYSFKVYSVLNSALSTILEHVFLNAVKSIAFVEKEKRHLNVRMEISNTIQVTLKYSYNNNAYVQKSEHNFYYEKINNFLAKIDGKISEQIEEGIKTEIVTFKNLWGGKELI